jgi:hypothetical protein
MRLTMRLDAPDLAALFKERVARGFTAAMKKETRALEKQFEGATVAAGLSQILARTWQSRSFPTNGDSIGPAGLIWTRAPMAMRAFAEGAVIVPKQGRFLAIPTVWNRQGGRRGAGPRVTPAQMVSAKGQAFVFKSKRTPGVKIWALRAAPLGGKGNRKYSVLAGGLAAVNASGSRAAVRAGNQRDLLKQGFVPMFVLVPRVVIRKRLNLPPMIQAAQARIRAQMAQVLAEAERSLGNRR